jgi:hypothetical protein
MTPLPPPKQNNKEKPNKQTKTVTRNRQIPLKDKRKETLTNFLSKPNFKEHP